MTMPAATVIRTACALICRAFSSLPAPKACEISARKPTPRAETVLPTSQFTVLVAPTAATARVPREPTMPVSIYCTAVCISCSSMVGQASVKMADSMALSAFGRFFVIPRIMSTRQLSVVSQILACFSCKQVHRLPYYNAISNTIANTGNQKLMNDDVRFDEV